MTDTGHQDHESELHHSRGLTPTDQLPELIPYDSPACNALELTYRQALRMGHNYIGTEHILLALLEIEAGTGVLFDLGVDKPTAEAHITGAVAATLAAGEHG